MIRPPYIAILAALLVAPIGSPALDLLNSPQFVLPSNSVIETQTALYASDAQLDGVAQDDLFVLAQNVHIPGQLTEDAWLAGTAVDITGLIGGHLRAIAQSVHIEGTLDRDLTSVSSVLRLTTNAVVEGQVDAIAEQASLEGQFRGNVRLLASSATIAGTYGGNVRVIAQDIVVLPGTRIAGNLTYTSPKELFLDRSVVLGGELLRNTPDTETTPGWQDYLRAAALHSAKAASALLAGLALMALFPRYTGRATRHLQRSAWHCAAAGSASFMLIPIAAVLLAITLIGLPLALIAVAAWSAFLYLGKVIVALAIGGALLRSTGPKRFSQTAVILLLGLALLYAVTFLPFIGGTAALLIGILGLGALVLALIRGEERHAPLGLHSDPTADESIPSVNVQRKG